MSDLPKHSPVALGPTYSIRRVGEGDHQLWRTQEERLPNPGKCDRFAPPYRARNTPQFSSRDNGLPNARFKKAVSSGELRSSRAARSRNAWGHPRQLNAALISTSGKRAT